MKELGEKLKAEGYDVFYVDFDENKTRAREEGVKAVPTAVVHAGGEEVHRYERTTSQTSMRFIDDTFRDTDDWAGYRKHLDDDLIVERDEMG
jgi:hypothetical protein